MYWATPDETGELPIYNPTENSKPTSAVLSNEYDTYHDRLEWSLTNDNEVLHLTSKSSSPCGIAFKLGEFRHNINIGTESNGAAEYIKIRIRNTSSSQKMSFAWTRSAYQGWSRAVSTIDIDPNMTGWYTIVINMRNLNMDTNPNEGSFWGGQIKDFIIFPFGYSGYGSEYQGYEGASMDIDYIVIGSYEYVSNYKSELEIKEDSATSFTPIDLPEKTTYYIGETLDLSGLNAKIEYSDGTVEYVDTASAIYDFDEPAESTTVTLKYGNHSFSYDVQVIGVDDVEIESLPEKTTYSKIDVLLNGFNPTGLSLKVNFADGTSQIKELGQFRLEGTDFSTAGDYIITINYYGTKTNLTIKIIDVEKITLSLHEEEKIYYGTEITADKFDITCIFNDGSEMSLEDAQLEEYFAVQADTKQAGGDTTAYASIINDALNIEIETEIQLPVQMPASLSVKNTQAKLKTKLESDFNTNNLSISYVYDDGTTASIDHEDPNLIIRYDTSTPGDHTGLVKIGSFSGEFPFIVSDAEFEIEPILREGKVDLLPAKFPTFWLVFIIVAIIVIVLVALFCVLKFVFKVDFKRKRKKVSLSDIF